jgi:hypothetical protein
VAVGVRLVGLLLAGWVAVVGGLALATFAKAVGIGFLGRARSHRAERAREGSAGMVGAQAGLAALCALAALLAPGVLRWMAPVRKQLLGSMESAGGVAAPVALAPIAGALVVGCLGLALWARGAAGKQPTRRFVTWECGFGELGPRTQYTAASFAQPIARMFGGFYHYSQELRLAGRDRRHFPEEIEIEPAYEPYLETRVYGPLIGFLRHLSTTLVARLQAGSIHQYLLYMVVALGVLLWLGCR